MTAQTGRPIHRDPLRLTLAAGAAIMVIGAVLPWAEGMIGFLPVAYGGLEGAGDGLILVTLGLVMLVIARSRDFLQASDEGRRYAPMLIGLICLGMWFLARRQVDLRIASWEDHGSASIAIGFWFAGIGALVVAVVGSFVGLRRHEGETSSPASFLRMPQRSDLVPLGAAFGGIAGAIAAGGAALALFPPTIVGAPLVIFVCLGFVAGAYAGRRLGTGVRRILG